MVRPHRGRVWVVLAVVAAAGVLGGSACSSSGGTTPSVAPASDSAATELPTVAVVGDSITEQGEQVLRDELSSRWDLEIDGRSGYTIEQQLPAAVALAAAAPSQLIVNLGTNDVLRQHPTEDVVADLQALLDAVDGVACIHVVTVAEGMVLGGYDHTAAAREANAAIAAALEGDDRVDLVDWAAEVRAYQAGPQPDGPILNDSIHPNDAGQRRLAALYSDALGGCGA
jgi:lysophospholipase L1-like esterase